MRCLTAVAANNRETMLKRFYNIPMTIRICEAWFSRDICNIPSQKSSVTEPSVTESDQPRFLWYSLLGMCIGLFWLAIQVSISQVTATLQNVYRANL